jgi:4-cresol dehydrogenase (hydroxylating) flavoprotein subunit
VDKVIDSSDRATSLNAEVVRALVEIVGEQYVRIDSQHLEETSRVTIPKHSLCSAVVYPDTVAEIQAIFKLAAQFKFKIWCFSRGNNWGYGTKNALEKEAIILILERMNRILEVNEDLAYAVVEPGVTQRQLNEYLQKNNSRLWTDCTDSTPYGSVLGNAIERGYGYTPYGDHFAHLCGMEVVLPNGELIRTGGILSNSNTWNTHKWGHGPYIEGLFSQSNFGIVVKAGIWLMPKPESFNVVTFDLADEANLPTLIDRLRELALEGIFKSHLHMVNDFQMLSVVSRYPYELLDGNTYLSAGSMLSLRQKYGIAPWSLVGAIYGSSAQLKLKQSSLKKHLADLGKLEFFDRKKVSVVEKFTKLYKKTKPNSLKFKLLNFIKLFLSPKHIEVMSLLPDMYGILQGIPTERIIKSAYFKAAQSAPEQGVNPARDNCGVMWLAPAFPASGKYAQELLDLVKPLYYQYGFDFSGCIARMGDRTFYALFGIFFDRDNAEESARAIELYQNLVETTNKSGYQLYRSGIPYWNCGNTESVGSIDLLKSIKETVDPEGIFAPGRYGIF